MNILYKFFDYKDFIDYHGEDYFSKVHIIFMVIATLIIIFLPILLRKANHDKITIYLRILAIIMPILEITKIVWETVWDLKTGKSFNLDGLLPLYTCSMFMFVLPFAAFGKGKIKEYSLAFLGTIGIVAGLTNFYLTQILHTYPFFTFASFMSLHYHFQMVFVGVFISVTGYYKCKWIDIIRGWIPLVLFSIIVIPANYIIQSKGYYPDYMLYMHGNGAPLLPTLSSALIAKNLQPLFTFIMVFVYILLSIIPVCINKGITYIISVFKKVNHHDSKNAKLANN
jgi:hypothetical protein